MHYYTFHIGDYASHTLHLDAIEDLAYRRLLDYYYLHEKPLPNDCDAVARMIRLRGHEKEIQTVLDEFFKQTDEGWISARANEEISKYHDKIEQASRAGKASAERRKNGRSTVAEQALDKRSTDVQPTNNQEPITNNHKPITNNKNAVACPADVSSDCWEAFIAHRKAVKALVTDRVVNSIRNEADKAGIPLQDALDEVVARGWKGFKAEWYKPMIRNEQPRKTQYQLNQEATARALGLMPQRTFDGEVYDVETVTKFLG